MIRTYGIFEFSNPIDCAYETFSSSIDIKISGYKGILKLPSFPQWDKDEEQKRKFLIGPEPAKKWKRGDKSIYWGGPVPPSVKNSYVNRALIEFKVLESDVDTATDKIYSNFNDWLYLFETYLKLLTKQYTRNTADITSNQSNIEIYRSDANQLKRIPNEDGRVTKINVTVGVDESLTIKNLKKSAKLASHECHPTLEYKMLLEAYEALRIKDYRKTIIEGAIAVETSLTTRIQEEFDNQGIRFGKKLLNRFRNLGGRFELARMLDIDIPEKDYVKLIMNPRNDVVHRALFPSKKLTNKFLTEVENLLNTLTPQFYEESAS